MTIEDLNKIAKEKGLTSIEYLNKYADSLEICRRGWEMDETVWKINNVYYTTNHGKLEIINYKEVTDYLSYIESQICNIRKFLKK